MRCPQCQHENREAARTDRLPPEDKALLQTACLYETQLFPEIEYNFKHAITHQVAYEALLQQRRQVLYARIVEALKVLAGERVECLASHALRGEVWDKAVTYCRQAGEKALPRSAYRDVVGSFEHALHALTHLPETHDADALVSGVSSASAGPRSQCTGIGA